LLRGEQAVAAALFGAALAVLITFGDRPGGITFGSAPVGTLVAITLFGVIVRRTFAVSNGFPGLAYESNPATCQSESGDSYAIEPHLAADSLRTG
jgi:hypothetical protein